MYVKSNYYIYTCSIFFFIGRSYLSENLFDQLSWYQWNMSIFSCWSLQDDRQNITD